MQGIGLKLANVEQVKQDFDALLKELQNKAKNNPIQINVADFNKLQQQLKEVENKVNQSAKNINKMTQKAFQGADKGDTYNYFRDAMNKVASDIRKNGGQISDVLTKVDEKTKSITGATVKYTDALGKAKTEFYSLQQTWKNATDDSGKIIKNKDGTNKKVLDSVDLKLTSTTYDNNIAKQQQDNYSKLNTLLSQRRTIMMELARLDDSAKGGDYENKLKSQLQANTKSYKDIINSKVKINSEEEQNAVTTKQTNDLLQKQKDIQAEIDRVTAKRTDPTLKKTSTTSSGKMNLGEEVVLGQSVNFNASREQLDSYAKAVAGTSAEWTKMTPKITANGEKIKEVSVRTKEGGDKWHNYNMILEESTGKLYKVDRGLSDVANRQLSFADKFKIAVQGITVWFGATNLIYGSLQKLKEGIETINELNKSQTNIQMIAGYSREQIQGMTKDYADLADQLHSTTTQVMSGAEEFLRAGHNIAETNSLLKASTIGGAISGQDNQAMADELIAISNGFKMATGDAKEMMGVIDTLSTLDNNSATSMAEIATALTRTASSAQMAGRIYAP